MRASESGSVKEVPYPKSFLRREAHRRWRRYFQRASVGLEEAAKGSREGRDAVSEYHLIYEIINQIIAGLQLAAEASAGRGVELSQAFAYVAQLLANLGRTSRGTAFENEDFSSQAMAAAALGCGNRPFEDRRCNSAQQRDWLDRQLGPKWAQNLMNSSDEQDFQRSWLRYLSYGSKAMWHEYSFTDEKKMWQLFPTYVMSREIGHLFSSSGAGCRACAHLTSIVLEKYRLFSKSFAKRPDEVNNAFFGWQLTHDAEQSSDEGQGTWPELYQDADFRELKWILKLSCRDYLEEISSEVTSEDLEELELSIWASVTSPQGDGSTLGTTFNTLCRSMLFPLASKFCSSR